MAERGGQEIETKKEWVRKVESGARQWAGRSGMGGGADVECSLVGRQEINLRCSLGVASRL